MSEQNQNQAGSNVADLEEKRQQARTIGKADLFKGAGVVEEHYIERIDGKIPMRRLTSGEWDEIQSLQSAGVSLKGQQKPGEKQGPMDMSVNIQESTRADALARRVAISKALSVNGEHYTEMEIAAIPDPKLVAELGEKVYEIAGVTSELQEQAKRVRQDAGGGEDSANEPVGVPAGDSAAGVDAASGGIPGGGVTQG